MLKPLQSTLSNVIESVSRKNGRRRNHAVDATSRLISTETLSERCLLSGVTDAPDGDLESDYMLRTDELRTAETSIQQRRFIVSALRDADGNLTGTVRSTPDGPEFVFDRNTSELILRVENRGEKGAVVSFRNTPDSASFGDVTLPAEERVPSGKFRRVTIRIPPQVSGEYRGVLVLKRFGTNTSPVEFRVSASVQPAATLLPGVKISADVGKVYYDFDIRNTGNGNGLEVPNIRFLDGSAPATGWRVASSAQPLNVDATGTWRVEADIATNTSRNVVVQFETNGTNGTLTHSVDLNYALERLNPVLIAGSATKHSWSSRDKTFTVHLNLKNDSIRDNLVILPEQIQVMDQFGQAIPLSLIKSGLPTSPITLLPQQASPLLLTLDTAQVASITDRYRYLQVAIQSNGGDKLLQLNLNAYMDRLVPTIQLNQDDGYTWDRDKSSLRYKVTITNNSIRDTLNVALGSTQLPQHVSVYAPTSGSLEIPSGRDATVTLEIFTDIPAAEIDNLRHFTASFFSNDPDNNPAQVTIVAGALNGWKDSSLTYGGLSAGDYECVGVMTFSSRNDGDRSITVNLNIEQVTGQYWSLVVRLNGQTVHKGTSNGQFVIPPKQTAVYTVEWTSGNDANTYRLSFSLDPLENPLLSTRTYGFWR